MTSHTAPAASATLNQHDLRRAVNRDRRLSACDRSCVGEIIDWYHADYGDAWICYDILHDKTGFSRSQLIRSVKRLREIGYIKLLAKGVRGVGRKGRDGDKGRGGNRYDINLSLGCKKQKADNPPAKSSVTDDTSNVEICSVIRETSKPECGVIPATAEPKCSVMDDTHSYLQDGPTRDRPTVGKYLFEEGTRGAATPPPPRAPVGAGAATPRDPVVAGFDALYEAYNVRLDRQKAKAAYRKLNPDAALQAQMAAEAARWAAHYNENGTEQKWRARLHTWIDKERWLEEPPPPYEAPKEASVSNRGRKGSKEASKKEASKKPATTTTPTAEVRREVGDAEKMKRVAEYARATRDTIEARSNVIRARSPYLRRSRYRRERKGHQAYDCIQINGPKLWFD